MMSRVRGQGIPVRHLIHYILSAGGFSAGVGLVGGGRSVGADSSAGNSWKDGWKLLEEVGAEHGADTGPSHHGLPVSALIDTSSGLSLA